MDLQLYFRVIWRFRALVLAGLVVAIVLTFFSVATIDTGKTPPVKYRESEQWVSVATMLVTESGFPLGRSVFEEEVPPVSTDKPQTVTPKFAPPGRFIELANTYALLVTGDAVRDIMLRDGPIRGSVEAVPLVSTSDASLPLVAIRGIATSPEGAVRVAQRASDAFQEYLDTEQDRRAIPAEQRVVLTEVRHPSLATTALLEGRSKTLPIVVFLTVMLAFIGLAFVLENLRPRVRPVPTELSGPQAARPARRARRSG